MKTSSLKYWFAPLVSGLLLIVLSLFTLAFPLSSFISLSILFSASLFVAGIVQSIFAIEFKHSGIKWFWEFLSGLVVMFIGAYLIMNQAESMLVLATYTGLFFLFKGVDYLTRALTRKEHLGNARNVILLFGVVEIMIGVYLTMNLLVSEIFTVYLLAFALMNTGVLELYLAYRVKWMMKAHHGKLS
ncbi:MULTISPECIES: HdeD family acid-resistance protein [Flammeovirga]|uniref:HdeD family acid-resistance protein n=1 Tax=Flammeovirga agarivorans TaxID=2726742 RepID=A0A7X8SIX9_9BACT|nr:MULTISPECIES: DUF308 domain-containing protein [Flammeovirga]NLR90982.1 hypothetical protein [Flammeovirga agarivorans]